MVDFTLTDEQKNLREMAHDFAVKEIRPVAWEYDKDGTWPQDIVEKAWDVGLMNSHIHRVAHLLPRQIEPLLFMLVDLALGRTYQIERLPFRRAHVFQNGFAGNATIHHPYTPRFAIGVFNLFEKAWQRSAIRRVALHHLIGQRQPIGGHHQRDHQLQT